MSINKYVLILSLIIGIGNYSFAQTTPELNRFNNESLTVRNQVKLFPNPSVDFLEIKINNATFANATFTVHNIIGNIVEAEIENVGQNQYRIKVKDLAPGYYLLAIKDDQQIFKETYKFLKR
jgi:hypothetical protein